MTQYPHGPSLAISLAAIARNYTLLSRQLMSGRSGAVVKANAYGLGVAQIAPALLAAGCRDFFVATLEEGIYVRKILSTESVPSTVYVFHGARKGESKDFLAHNLIPVLNDRMQIACWNHAGPAALHIDTGMCRLGVTPEEAIAIAAEGQKFELLLSHLACADEPSHPKNNQQLAAFRAVIQHFPGTPASFANSSGIFLNSDYHYDIARPGCSLYGISPNTDLPNPMEHVATLSAPVLQYRTLTQDTDVGYSATARMKAGTVLATVELGYADGFHRALSNHAFGYAGDVRVPLIGRVSMDMVSVDVTQVPAHLHTPDMRIAFICEQQPVDVLAEAAGTIGYEIFTGMGNRVRRMYA